MGLESKSCTYLLNKHARDLMEHPKTSNTSGLSTSVLQDQQLCPDSAKINKDIQQNWRVRVRICLLGIRWWLMTVMLWLLYG